MTELITPGSKPDGLEVVTLMIVPPYFGTFASDVARAGDVGTDTVDVGARAFGGGAGVVVGTSGLHDKRTRLAMTTRPAIKHTVLFISSLLFPFDVSQPSDYLAKAESSTHVVTSRLTA
jgi:hypothetical protein